MNRTERPVVDVAREQPAERADLAAWRKRHALRSSSAAQPIRSKRTYRRSTKHRKREQD